MNFENNLTFAQQLDALDPLAKFRDQYYLPKAAQGNPLVYFNGNSLGLQPKSARAHIASEMEHWEKYGVEGHFKGKKPWFDYHHAFKKSLGQIVGGNEVEVAPMNSLTVNLHLLMVSFYRPTKQRFKILMEAGAFPSDQYMAESQVRFHGFDPDEAIVELQPRAGEYTLRTEDIMQTIEGLGDTLALVLIGGVNYATGQCFDMASITQAGHRVGAYVGFDLAHAVGNVILHLHDWKVDFAAWCSYKYLNSGPGGIAGIYVHETHATNPEIPRFAGWWGYEEKTRFLMKKGFVPEKSVDAWQLSNVPILLLAAHRAALELFDEAGMPNLREKSKKLSAYAIFILQAIAQETKVPLKILSPLGPEQRGCQLSVALEAQGKELFERLLQKGCVLDWREPNIIRLAPVPMYNTFEEVYQFGQILHESLLGKA